jgi:general secretion pathway protein K
MKRLKPDRQIMEGRGARSQNMRGAALLSAMLVVSLVASLAVASNWQVWRALELETAERSRQQSTWILSGALDWSRLILREDARANQNNPVDHLSEPWALPLAEAKLASFLDEQRDALSEDDRNFDAYLSGQISDLQGRLNVSNLITADGKRAPKAWSQWQALYTALDLPLYELENWVQALLLAQTNTVTEPLGRGNQATPSSPYPVAIKPNNIAQLRWLGMSELSFERLKPHISLLPQRAPINLNTASAEVLQAVFPGLSRSSAQQLVVERGRSFYKDLTDVQQRLPFGVNTPDSNEFSVSTNYFEVRGRLRLQGLSIEERSTVWRNNGEVQILRRERGVGV